MASVSVSSSAAPGARRDAGRGRYALVGVATVVAAVLANVVVYAVGDAVVGFDPRFPPLARVDGAVILALVPAIVAVPCYGLVLRRAAEPARVFGVAAAVAVVVAAIPVVVYVPTVPGASATQTAVLVLMHVVAAGVIVGMLTGLAERPARSRGERA